MSDNQAVIRRMFDEVINLGKLELVDELFDPEFTSTQGAQVMDREAFKGFIMMWRTAFPDVHCEVGDFVEEGDNISWSVRAVGTQTGDFMGIPPTGRSIDSYSLNTATMRDGRGYRHRVVMDTGEMLMQLGVLPAPEGM